MFMEVLKDILNIISKKFGRKREMCIKNNDFDRSVICGTLPAEGKALCCRTFALFLKFVNSNVFALFSYFLKDFKHNADTKTTNYASAFLQRRTLFSIVFSFVKVTLY